MFWNGSFIFSQYVLLKKWRKWIMFIRIEISCNFFLFVTLWYGPMDHPTVPLWYCWYRRDCSLFCWTVRTQSAHYSFHTPMSIMTRISRRNPAIIVTHIARNTCPMTVTCSGVRARGKSDVRFQGVWCDWYMAHGSSSVVDRFSV